ncbi:retrovirus-related pol polyprotein from transposon TNT 1-94 [Tanacetum coccineum]
MTGNRSKLMNFVEKFIGSVRFGNDHLGAIMGYGDYVMGDSVISRVYYVEGLGHNLFSVGQFCDSDLEVAFRKHTCFVRDINGTDILKGSRSTNLYTISMDEMMKSSPICLLSKASKSKSWFEKGFLARLSIGKSRKVSSHRPKSKNTNIEVLHTLHMDLCGPMRVQSIKGKKYILVIVDDYSRFTWVKFLRSKDETPEFVTNFLKQIQVGLNKTVRFIRTDNGTEFVNQVMSEYYEGVGIFHQKSVPRTPQQNGVVERRNRTLVEAARTMMIFSKAPMFLWAEAVATACYTQNRSLIHTRHNKTPYELVHDKKPDLTFFRVFGALCYPTNDSENLGKFQAKADIGIFVGYAPSRKGYRIYNKRTRRLMETIHVTFDEMHQSMAPTFATEINGSTSLSTTIAQDAPSQSASSYHRFSSSNLTYKKLQKETHSRRHPQSSDVLHLHIDLVTGDIVPRSNLCSWFIASQADLQWEADEYGDVLKNKLEKFFVSQTEGFEDQENPTHVYRLKKALYGLKQAPRAWYDTLSKFLLANNFFKGAVDHTVLEWNLLSLSLHDASRPDLVFAVCMCARYQAKPTKKHFEAIKRVFRYLKGTINMGLWYPKDNAMSLTAYADADHAGCQDSRKSTEGVISFLEIESSKTTDLTSIKFLCTVITKVLLLFAVTTSSTLALNTSTYGTISSESKWKTEWLNSTSWKRTINLQTSSPKHYQEKGSNFFFHA